jgi:hypothetical protein
VFLDLFAASNFFDLTKQTMTEHVTQPINSADSDLDVQEIDPPVLLRSP